MFIYSIICSHVSNIMMQVQHSGLIFIYLFLGLEFCFHFKLFNIWLYRQLDTMGPNKWKIWIMPMISRSLRAFNSLPNYSTNPAPYPPPQHFDYAARPQYHSSNTGNHVFPLSYSNSTYTPTTHCSYPHNGASNGYAPQWSGHIPNNFHNGYASQLGSVQHHGAYHKILKNKLNM